MSDIDISMDIASCSFDPDDKWITLRFVTGEEHTLKRGDFAALICNAGLEVYVANKGVIGLHFRKDRGKTGRLLKPRDFYFCTRCSNCCHKDANSPNDKPFYVIKNLLTGTIKNALCSKCYDSVFWEDEVKKEESK